MQPPFYAVGIGASAGGHQALYEFFENLPPIPRTAFFIVAHLARDHRSILDRIMARHTEMPVVRAVNRMEVRAGTVYVLAEGMMMELEGNMVKVRRRTPSETINRAVDIFFSPLALAYADRAIGIVLSGAGCDGSEGAIRITEHGGRVLVQAPTSSAYASMPTAVIDKDHPVAIRRPADLAKKLSGMVATVPEI